MIIGGYNTTSNLFNGKMDEVAIYNRALSPAEILTRASSGPYVQTAGTTAVSGTLTAVPSIQGGTLALGTGTISNLTSLWKGEGTAVDSTGANPGSFVNPGSDHARGQDWFGVQFQRHQPDRQRAGFAVLAANELNPVRLVQF